MEKPNKNVNFDNIWQRMKFIDFAVGLFLFKDPVEKISPFFKFLAQTQARHAILLPLFITSTLVITNFELISVIFVASLITLMMPLHFTLLNCTMKKEKLKELFKWCGDQYDVQNYFHPRVQKIADAQMLATERFTVTTLKWLRILLYVDNIGYSLGFPIIGYFLPEHIYPKFSPPVPFYLPFSNQQTWMAFISNILFITILCIDAATITIYCLFIFVCSSIQIIGYLDIVLATVKKMRVDLMAKVKRFCVVEEPPNDPFNVTFEEWIQIIIDMIDDVNKNMNIITDIYAVTSMLTEFASLGAIFICGMIFVILQQQYFFAIGMSAVALMLYMVCYVNEKILEKYKSINAALYDIPWYALAPKQRKLLLIALNCDNIQKGFTAANIHGLTIERFGIVVKIGYTNFLVLKDLIQK